METIEALLAEQRRQQLQKRQRSARSLRIVLVVLPLLLIAVLVPGLIWLNRQVAGSASPSSGTLSPAGSNVYAALKVVNAYYLSNGASFEGATSPSPVGLTPNGPLTFGAVSASTDAVSVAVPNPNALVLTVFQAQPARVGCEGVIVVKAPLLVPVDTASGETSQVGNYFFDATTTSPSACNAARVTPLTVSTQSLPGGRY